MRFTDLKPRTLYARDAQHQSATRAYLVLDTSTMYEFIYNSNLHRTHASLHPVTTRRATSVNYTTAIGVPALFGPVSALRQIITSDAYDDFVAAVTSGQQTPLDVDPTQFGLDADTYLSLTCPSNRDLAMTYEEFAEKRTAERAKEAERERQRDAEQAERNARIEKVNTILTAHGISPAVGNLRDANLALSLADFERLVALLPTID